MFEAAQHRLFAVPIGADFPKALIKGLAERLHGMPPDAWARTTIIVNTRRMQRRLQTLLIDGAPRLLPKIRLLSEMDQFLTAPPPPSVSPLARRLSLARLIGHLRRQDPSLVPEAHIFDLADSLARLMDEMQGEGVSPDALLSLDVSGHSEYWARSRAFVAIAAEYLQRQGDAVDAEARQRQVVQDLAQQWAIRPHPDPIILAGSTGSRGTTLDLMTCIARLPQGAVILPGLDTHLPRDVWKHLIETRAEDHPQFRLAAAAEALDVPPSNIAAWTATSDPNQARHRAVSLALRPAPVTDAWIDEGPGLGNLSNAMERVTLVETETMRHEAMTIALRLRQAAEDGITAALITPDRTLTRQVTAALDRWHIQPDDSAGTPLHLSPPGRFLRHVLDLIIRPLDAERLLTMLKHPLTHSGTDRNRHQLNTQRFELELRARGVPFPDPQSIADLCTRLVPEGHTEHAEIAAWGAWAAQAMCHSSVAPQSLSDWVSTHIAAAERIAAGPLGQADELWAQAAGRTAKTTLETVFGAVDDVLSPRDYERILTTTLMQGEVRDRDTPHPDIMIWGTLEARVQGADLIILGGLNDGTWPALPDPDPWLNRDMRRKAGLFLPERRIGLSAHDFQQAMAAPEIWITRSIRSDEAETVPSRWINRLENLLAGLRGQNGPEALAQMRTRGRLWLSRVAQFEAVEPVAKAPRPSPILPNRAASSIKSLRVTEVETLIRDPYAIYARHALRLAPLNPLVPTPEAALRGSLAHEVLEQFVKRVGDPKHGHAASLFQSLTRKILEDAVPWPAIRALWIAKLDQVADWFVQGEEARQAHGRPFIFETSGQITLPQTEVALRGRADRIDLAEDCRAILYDYKSGQPPTDTMQRYFNKQLLLEAGMVALGGFSALGQRGVARAEFIGLGSGGKTTRAPLDTEPPESVLAKLDHLLGQHIRGEVGFSARRAMQRVSYDSDYDLLARFGEWDIGDTPVRLELGHVE